MTARSFIIRRLPQSSGRRANEACCNLLYRDSGAQLADKIACGLERSGWEAECFCTDKYAGSTGLKPSGELRTWCKEQWKKSDCILFIGAAGIAVRAIAPYVADKTRDPAVIVTGQDGKIRHISFIGTYRRGQRFCRRDCGDYRRAGGNNYCHGHCREICRGRICPEKRAFNLLYGAGKRGVGCRAQGGESRIFF